MTSALAIACALSCAPQGPGVVLPPPHQAIDPDSRPILAYPTDVDSSAIVPVVDAAGAPLRTAMCALGFADFDGDGNQDLWFLPRTGPFAGGLRVQTARTSDLGRYLAWADYAAAPFADAATFRSSVFARDMVVLAAPGSSSVSLASYFWDQATGPRGGNWQLDPNGWRFGAGSFEVETSDHAGDGHDDVVLLQDLGGGATRIKSVYMGTSLGFMGPEREVTLDLPVPLEKLRSLDVDGDALTDVLVLAPGAGAAVFREGQGTLELALFVPAPAGVLDLFTGDVDEDGRDDVGLVFAQGVLVYLSRATGSSPVALPSPAGAAALATARVLDGDGDGHRDVVALAADGSGLIVHPFDPLADRFAGPRLVAAPGQVRPGPGLLGESALVADVDADGDDDLIAQLPSGERWLTLRDPARSLAPVTMRVAHGGRWGEKGYIRELITVTVPQEWAARGLSQVELGVFIKDIVQTGEFVYWGRLILPVDPFLREARFPVYYMTDLLELNRMITARQPYIFPDGITAGGDTMLTFHAKVGPQRFASLLLFHEREGDENKSTLGVKWKVVAAPPLPETDDELLPWN